MIYVDARNGPWPQNHSDKDVTRLRQFRQELSVHFGKRPNEIMNLIDSVCSNTVAKSVVELSLNPIFNYQYTSVFAAIDPFFTPSTLQNAKTERHEKEMQLMEICLRYLPPPAERRFWLFGVDTTPQPRPYAQTLSEESVVYHPNPVGKNRPITIGHQYAALVFFPEKPTLEAPPWVVPLSIRRIHSDEKATAVHAQQVTSLLGSDGFASENRLCVCVADSSMSAAQFLGEVTAQKQLVTIARVRANRVLYRKPKPQGKRKKGCPRWYGDRLALKEPSTWGDPAEILCIESVTQRGRKITIELQAWHHLLMRGTRQYKMHRHPLTLVRVQITDASGKLVFKRPLWLCVIGEKRHQLSLSEIYHAYRQRYDIEHFFRFGKQKLLTTAYQTPVVEHEENWWQITQLADVQLFLARQLAMALPRPWEKYLAPYRTQTASPAWVQRDFGRILAQIEPKRVLPKPRGKSPGRQKGVCPGRRERQKVIYKTANR